MNQFKKHISACLLAISLSMMGNTAIAAPKVSEVKAAMARNDFTQAERLMLEVLAEAPNSAKAHYIYGEILLKDGRFAEAKTQLAKAKELDPALKFAKTPETFKKLEQQANQAALSTGSKSLENQVSQQRNTSTTTKKETSAPPAQATKEEKSGMGMMTILFIVGGLCLVVYILYRVAKGMFGMFGGNNQNAMSNGYNQGNMGGGFGGMAQGMGGMPPQQGSGGGIASHLLTGAGGFAAGMLVDRMLNSNDAHASSTQNHNNNVTQHDNNNAHNMQQSADYSTMDIDYGSGGDSWDSGSSSSDAGSSSSDDSW